MKSLSHLVPEGGRNYLFLVMSKYVAKEAMLTGTNLITGGSTEAIHTLYDDEAKFDRKLTQIASNE